ncbi:hypothetical protein Syun_011577 [Stephania yunnanensis]|uniref:Uncharacterized protein n=1 Tax=Stephania yunnanensis TaxID=152371 RepID=A0AAP0PFK6_9MAGN
MCIESNALGLLLRIPLAGLLKLRDLVDRSLVLGSLSGWIREFGKVGEQCEVCKTELKDSERKHAMNLMESNLKARYLCWVLGGLIVHRIHVPLFLYCPNLVVHQRKTYYMSKGIFFVILWPGSQQSGPFLIDEKKITTKHSLLGRKANNQDDLMPEWVSYDVLAKMMRSQYYNIQTKKNVRRCNSRDSDEDFDQEEREQLERNMRNRDAAATKKLGDPRLTPKEEEEAVCRFMTLEQGKIGALRKISRQEYLKKREQKKMEERRDDIMDEEYLFEGVKLTDVEYRLLRYKRQIYELVKERSNDVDNVK